MHSVCIMKHLLERGWVRDSVQDSTQVSMRSSDLGSCVGAGFVRRPHLLVGGAHSVTTALKVVKKRRKCKRLRMKGEDEEVEGNGDQGRRRTAHFMHG